MLLSRCDLKALLVAARRDPPMREHERRCVAAAGDLATDQIDIVDLLSEPLPSEEALRRYHFVVLGGTGDYRVSQDRPSWYAPLRTFTLDLLNRGVPTLGICYGFHLMAEAVGGEVRHCPDRGETGTHEVALTPEGQQDVLFTDLPTRFEAQQGHHDVVFSVPDPFVRLAYSANCPWQALRHARRPFYGLQFHPELTRADLLERMRIYADIYMADPEEQRDLDTSVRETGIQAIIRRFVDAVVIPAWAAPPAHGSGQPESP